MYTRLAHVVLVEDQAKRRPGDGILYRRDVTQWDTILTSDPSPSKHVGPAVRYGTFYEAANGDFCVVPDVWEPDEAMQAKAFVSLG